MRGFFSMGLCILLAGCSHPGKRAVCSRNSDCSGEQICFVDGCGDPGEDVVAEVIPSGTNQPFPEDFALGTVSAVQDLQIVGPSTVGGPVLQNIDLPDGGVGTVPYTDSLSVIAEGQGLALPGPKLQYEALLTPDKGLYSLEVTGGTYSVSAYPRDLTIPPVVQSGEHVAPGDAFALGFTFSAPSQRLFVQGKVAKAEGLPVDVGLAVQAFDTNSEPLSQKVGFDGGAFAVMLASAARSASSFVLTFSSLEPSSPAPQKSFTVAMPGGADAGVYLLGDYGTAFNATGRILNSLGLPLASVPVHLEGTVYGGGTYVSPTVLTDTDGNFSLLTLPSEVPGNFQLIAIPPYPSTSGLFSEPTPVSRAAPDLGSFRAPDRIILKGGVRLPDGVTPVADVTVTAVPVGPLTPLRPVPPQGDKATTDPLGNFSLTVDPADYRLDFVGNRVTPWLSTFARVDGTVNPVQLPLAVLFNGRQLTGVVTRVEKGRSRAPQPVPLAFVRFYRKVEDLGSLRAIPLAQGFTDPRGNYKVTIPTR